MSHTVLVVDDEPFVRVTLATLRMWRDEGYDFRFEASNGAQALELLREHPEIDIVLLDLAMPVLDGIGFLEAVTASGATPLPSVVVLSAHDDFPLVRKAFNLGAKDYMLKSEVDGEALAAIFSKLETPHAPPTELRSGETEFLAERWLQDILAGASANWSPLSERLGGLVEFPCTVWAVSLADFETVSHRHGPDLARFGQLFLRTVQQVADRRGGGRAVMMAPDLVAVLGGPGLEPDLFQEELKALLERYLSVKVLVSGSPPQPEQSGLADAWKDLLSLRPPTSRIVLQTRRYLRAHFATPGISLEQLAEHVGVSRNHLSYEFTRETGQTITDYLARLRIEAACHYLATTTLKVYEIAERVGYPNVEHFCRVFRKVSGTTPARWASEETSNVSRDIRQ